MEVLIFEIIVRFFRYPGALFLSVVTVKSVSYWLDHSGRFGIAIVGMIVTGVFVAVMSWASS